MSRKKSGLDLRTTTVQLGSREREILAEQSLVSRGYKSMSELIRDAIVMAYSKKATI
jgi:Arc/MetJ-type ribon-helix-helix transcriptional regulator